MFTIDQFTTEEAHHHRLIQMWLDLAKSVLGADSAAFYLSDGVSHERQLVVERGTISELIRGQDWKQADLLEVFPSHVIAPVFSFLGFRCGTVVLESSAGSLDWNDQKTSSLDQLCTLMGELFGAGMMRQMLQQNSRLATLGQMTAEIMHEINNPICILQTGLHLMLLQIDRQPSSVEFYKTMIHKLLNSTKRLTEIITDVKNFSRSSDAETLEEVSVSELIQHSIAFCSERFKSASVHLILDAIPQGLKIYCRKSQFSQVMVNLINNAIDAVQDTADPWVKVQVENHGNKVGIRIEDSGNGIDQKDQHQLFKPFFTTKNGNGGTGLGLSISRNIMESNLGSLDYELSRNGHTSFLILLTAVQNVKDSEKIHLQSPASGSA
jgi:signal transduction histidine kinase